MSSTLSPYPEGSLPVEHQAEIVKIRTTLKSWLSAMKDVRRNTPGAKERHNSETEALAALEVSGPFAFTPAPPQKFQRVLLSIVRCYWLALVSSRSDAERKEIGRMLDLTPPFGKRVPRFDGKKCVEEPGELSAKEYEGMMRVIVLLLLDMEGLEEIQKSWQELAEVGIQTWEGTDGDVQSDDEVPVESDDEDEEWETDSDDE